MMSNLFRNRLIVWLIRSVFVYQVQTENDAIRLCLPVSFLSFCNGTGFTYVRLLTRKNDHEYSLNIRFLRKLRYWGK